MKKKFLVVAVGAALAAPMIASADGPTVYGKFHMSFDRVDNGSGTATAENGYISNNTSRFGIKGNDDVGAGMKAVYQVEIPFQADGETGSASDQTAAGTNQGTNRVNIATRATFVGLEGGFGSFKVGKQDHFMKSYGRSVDLFNERVGDSRNVYQASVTEGGFQNNSITYSSPKIAGGLNLDVSYSTGENNSNPVQAVVSSVGIKWAKGPLMVGVVQGENHGGGANAESVTRLVASYKAGAFGVYFMNDTQDNVGSPAGATHDRTVMGVGVSFKMGNSTFKLQNYTADKYDDAGATPNGGSLMALGVDHALSKSTTVYLAYAKSDNDAGASISTAGSGHGDVGASAQGKSGTNISLGMELLF